MTRSNVEIEFRKANLSVRRSVGKLQALKTLNAGALAGISLALALARFLTLKADIPLSFERNPSAFVYCEDIEGTRVLRLVDGSGLDQEPSKLPPSLVLSCSTVSPSGGMTSRAPSEAHKRFYGLEGKWKVEIALKFPMGEMKIGGISTFEKIHDGLFVQEKLVLDPSIMPPKGGVNTHIYGVDNASGDHQLIVVSGGNSAIYTF